MLRTMNTAVSVVRRVNVAWRHVRTRLVRFTEESPRMSRSAPVGSGRVIASRRVRVIVAPFKITGTGVTFRFNPPVARRLAGC